jgi:hypothetical protein
MPKDVFNQLSANLRVWAYCGPLDKAEEAFRPVQKFRSPQFELTAHQALLKALDRAEVLLQG